MGLPEYYYTGRIYQEIKNPGSIYKDGNDFIDPLFVVVHQHMLLGNLVSNLPSVKRVLKQIEEIKSKYDYIDIRGPSYEIDPRCKNKINIVCGCFDELCVQTQFINLRVRQIPAFISNTGILKEFELELEIDKLTQ